MNCRRVVSLAVLGLLLLSSPLLSQQPSEQFRRWDRNQDGKLSRDELPEFVRPLFDQIDTDKDGSISPEEDQKFVARRPAAPNQATPANQPPQTQGPRIPESVKVELDLPYAGTENPRQKLDLYLPKSPKSDKPLPVVAYIHGGAWQSGDKRNGYRMIAPLVESGEYAGVSIGYRLSGEATWPAQIHDCKAAIRWLRANAGKYNLAPDCIAVMGTSAGGHLVAVLGTSGDVAALEGNLGGHTGVSSRVQCVIDQFGPADFLAFGTNDSADGPVARLLGGPTSKNEDVARNASATTHVTQDDPPFLIIHGTRDPVVPLKQSELMHDALNRAGVDSLLVLVEGGGHGNFGTSAVPERIKQFCDKHLRRQDVTISAEPIQAPSR